MSDELFQYYIAALCGLVALAWHRRNIFPLLLVIMYVAFFCINRSYEDAFLNKLTVLLLVMHILVLAIAIVALMVIYSVYFAIVA